MTPHPLPYDLGPVSSFVQSMPKMIQVVGICPICEAGHVFIFVPAVGATSTQHYHLVEPFHEDRSVSPVKSQMRSKGDVLYET